MFAMLVGAGLVIVGAAVAIHHRRGWRPAMLACAFRRLRATEAQKQQLTTLIDDARSRMQPVKQRAHALHGELIDVLAAPAVDAQQLEALEAHLFEVMGEGTQVLRDAIARLHATLEPRQRQQLADWLRRAGHHHHHHHHCHAAACHC
jgi:Spy/CpxP family protein refolding chaperone